MNVQDFASSEYGSHRYITILTVERLEDLTWKVTNKVAQERSSDGVDWETKDVQFISIDESLERAISQSWLDTAQYLDSVEHNLFLQDSAPSSQLVM